MDIKNLDIHGNAMDNTRYLERILRLAFVTPNKRRGPADPACAWGAPVILWGEAGIGKTDRITGVASELLLPTFEVFGSSIEPPDVGGALVPILDPSGKREPEVRRVPALPQVQDAVNAKESILFLDEIGDAPPSVQKAIQGAILTRRFGSLPLPKGVRTVAAANGVNQGGMFRLGAPFANRLLHFEIARTDVSTWSKYELGELPPYSSLETLQELEGQVAAGWEVHYRSAVRVISEYLKRNETQLHLRPSDPALASRAWPSSRSWSTAARIMATGVCINETEEVIDLAMAGAVGLGPISELRTYIQELNLPTMDEVLAGKWKPSQLQLDVAYLVYAAMRQRVYQYRAKSTPAPAEEINTIWTLMDQADQAGVLDVALIVVDELVHHLKVVTPNLRQVADRISAQRSRLTVRAA